MNNALETIQKIQKMFKDNTITTRRFTGRACIQTNISAYPDDREDNCTEDHWKRTDDNKVSIEDVDKMFEEARRIANEAGFMFRSFDYEKKASDGEIDLVIGYYLQRDEA